MRFWIHTYGCQMNVRDSEAAAALLLAAGHEQAASEAEADLVIVNSCSIRAKAEDKAIGKIGLLCAGKRERPSLLVGLAGCMAQRLGEEVFARVPLLDFSLGTRLPDLLPGLVERAARGETRLLALGGPADHGMPRGHLPGAPSAYVSILLGCDRRCAYCIVPDVRGPEYSRPAADVLAEVRALVDSGAREITLLGQSVMNYGRQPRQEPVWPADAPAGARGFTEPFPRLLEAASAVPGLRRLRFTSGHPSGCTAELARAMAELPAVCPHLHLPVQSGSDRILRAMRRGYTRAGYVEAVARLRAAVPDFAVTTDVIVGFPGETEEDFDETRTLLREIQCEKRLCLQILPATRNPGRRNGRRRPRRGEGAPQPDSPGRPRQAGAGPQRRLDRPLRGGARRRPVPPQRRRLVGPKPAAQDRPLPPARRRAPRRPPPGGDRPRRAADAVWFRRLTLCKGRASLLRFLP
jgi:tRNA-2-methylthio-N6-dimethylallyladenosine synthase